MVVAKSKMELKTGFELNLIERTRTHTLRLLRLRPSHRGCTVQDSFVVARIAGLPARQEPRRNTGCSFWPVPPARPRRAMVDYSKFEHIAASSSDEEEDPSVLEGIKSVAKEVLGQPGGPHQNIDEMLESFRQGEARRRPADHPLLPPPRFDVGARVTCCVDEARQGVGEDEGLWLQGTVLRHWATADGVVCPYVVQVDEDRGEIWVHEDNDSAVRAVAPPPYTPRKPNSLAEALVQGLGEEDSRVARALIEGAASGDLKEVKRALKGTIPATLPIRDPYPLTDEACPVSRCVATTSDGALDVWGTAFLASLKSERIERSALSGAFANGQRRCSGRLPVVHELIKGAAKHGVDNLGATKSRDGRRALLWAADAANDDEAAQLVAAVRAAGARDLDADVALARAAARGRGALVAALLADWSPNRSAAPALHRAADAGHVEIVRALLARCDVDAETARGSTPLLLALDKGRGMCVAALLEAGADPLRDKTKFSLRCGSVVPGTPSGSAAVATAYVNALTTLAITRPDDVLTELYACIAAAPKGDVANVLKKGLCAVYPMLSDEDPESGPSIAHPGDDDGRASRHDHLSTLGVKKLKALAADCGVDLTGCCEKSEIVALLRVAYDAGTARANAKIKKAVAAMPAPPQEPWDFAADAKNSGGRKEPAKKKSARPPVTAEPVACAKVEDYFDGRGHKTDFATSAARRSLWTTTTALPTPTLEKFAGAVATSKKNAKKRNRKKRASNARQAAVAVAASAVETADARAVLETADASLARFDELEAAIDGEAEPLDDLELAAVAAAEEGVGAKTLGRRLRTAEEAGADTVARARDLEADLKAVLSDVIAQQDAAAGGASDDAAVLKAFQLAVDAADIADADLDAVARALNINAADAAFAADAAAVDVARARELANDDNAEVVTDADDATATDTSAVTETAADPADADDGDSAVEALLTRLGLIRFLGTFQENEVDAVSLKQLTSSDLAEMKVPVGPRRLILDALVEDAAAGAPQRRRPRKGARSRGKM